MNEKELEDHMNEEAYVGKLLKKKIEKKKEEELESISDLDHQELQSIVNNLVKLPDDNPAPPPPPAKIARITHHQISAMRVTQSNMPAATIEKKIKGGFLIRLFDSFTALFKPGEKRARCLVDGHECKHCGQIFKS